MSLFSYPKRRFRWPYIEAMGCGGQSREALPSSDAAVMAANGLLLSARGLPKLAIGMYLLACFGRNRAPSDELFIGLTKET